ncbi:MAG: hypothetical protein NPMRTH4_1930002 [Nitrosopumilales archaeon]|nr:MAG: hypothetical protein NPMRTH4_1930002 [Nitrosopumilales archaeon]
MNIILCYYLNLAPNEIHKQLIKFGVLRNFENIFHKVLSCKQHYETEKPKCSSKQN